MPRQTPIDITEFLSQVVKEHVKEYPFDLEYDLAALTNAAKRINEQDRTYYWMGLQCGTRLVKERNVFLMGSSSYQIWLHYASAASTVRAYRVTVTGMEDGKIMGTVCPIQYAAQVKRVYESARPIATVKLLFPDGYEAELPYHGWADHQVELKEAHGNYHHILFQPASEAELAQILQREHQTQEKEAKEQARPKKARHSPER